MKQLFETFLVSFFLSLIFTGLVRFISKKLGFVSYPDGQRWNKRVVALGGGAAMVLAITACFFWRGNSLLVSLFPAFFGMFLLGFYDDIWGTSPSVKLIVQVICAAYVVSKGFSAPFPWIIPGIAITVIWIVGMTNSLNLIDNMDGLASGCTAIAALGIALVLFESSPRLPAEILVLVSVSGAALGFLFHNFNPARIFMGDAGSLPLGFLMAVLSTRMKLSRPEISSIYSVILILLILIVPLLDTLLVIVARRRANRSITVGGRDHTSHRLVALGLTERQAVLVLYAFGALGAIGALVALPSSLVGVLTILLGMIALAVLFAIFLLEIAVYPPAEGVPSRRLREPFPIHIQYLIEIALDICAVTACWLAAHLIRFHDSGIHYYRESAVIPFLPYVITTKLVALLLFKLYRGIWRSISTRDIYQVFKASILGSTCLALGLLFFTRLADISRMVLVMDGLLCFLTLVGVRTGLIALRRWTRRIASKQSNAVYFGDSSLYPWIEEAIANEKGLKLLGTLSLGEMSDPARLEKRVREGEIDVVLMSGPTEDSWVDRVISLGVMVRRIKIQLV